MGSCVFPAHSERFEFSVYTAFLNCFCIVVVVVVVVDRVFLKVLHNLLNLW